MKKIKLAIAEDHPLFRQALASMVNEFDHFELIIQASNGKELIEKIEKQMPDVILMDIRMPEMDGIDATSHIKQKYPEVKIIMLSQYDGEFTMLAAMKSGANGYLLKDTEPKEIIEAICVVAEKGNYYTEEITEIMQKGLVGSAKLKPGFNYVTDLTKRELDVLHLICKGHSDKEIADKLCIAPKTVEGHRNHLREKFNVKNSSSLIICALQFGVINLDYRIEK